MFVDIGSAATGSEIYLKSLSMAPNDTRQHPPEIRYFTTESSILSRCHLLARRHADQNTPFYYFRRWKMLLTRAVAESGQSYFTRSDHRISIPSL